MKGRVATQLTARSLLIIDGLSGSGCRASLSGPPQRTKEVLTG